MIRSRIGRVVRVTIPVVLLVVVTSVVTLSAQGNPTLNEMLAKLDTIIEMLTPTPPAPADPVTLASAPLTVENSSSFVSCLLANLGTEVVQAQGNIRVADGSPIGSFETLIVQPGSSRRISAIPIEGITARCEFTIDQPAATVRALMQVHHGSDGQIVIADMR